MLKQLRVKNFALIDEATLQFEAGLNVLTGETGAGKSILMEALGFALGERLESEWLRPGKVLAVEAVFEIPNRSKLEKELAGKGIRSEEGLLHIKRESEAAGKTKSFLNGLMIPSAQLKDIAPFLVDIFGQRDGESLYQPSEQGMLLDKIAGIEEEVTAFRALYECYAERRETRKNFLASLEQKERELDLLRFQVKEIESAQIESEEDSRLAELKVRLSASGKLGTLFKEAHDLLYNGEPSAFDLAGRANRVLQALAKTDTSQEAKELQEETENLEVRMGELVRALGKYGESLEHDPGKLERTMERIDLLDRLKKKYGKTLSEVLSFLERAKQRLDLLESSEENLKNFDREIEALEKSMELKAREISKSRKQAALKLEKAIQRELESLEMKGARFEVKIAEGEFNARGKDQIEFYLSANPGEELKPLAKVASGGESSRLQLALKKYFSQVELVSTFIFDEIDSGIGARLAPVIGEKLSAIAKDHAVIAITHLAPVASQANCHWQALKQAERGKTVVKFVKLEGEARLQEIAKMLSGKKVTDASLKHAEEILNS